MTAERETDTPREEIVRCRHTDRKTDRHTHTHTHTQKGLERILHLRREQAVGPGGNRRS